MVVSKEKVIEWELVICDIAKDNILKEDYKSVEIVQKKEKVRSSFLKKAKEMIKNKEGLAYAIIVNILILVGLIVVISLIIGIGGLLMDPYLIFSVLFMVLLFVMYEVFRLVDKETSCKS